MKIFITGATGFIGSELLRQLQDTGHELFCLVRATSPGLHTLKASGVTVIEGDVRDKAAVRRGMEGCDWVIHLAALVSFWEADNDLYRQINREGTRNVMECALETGVRKVANITAILNFGKPADAPFTEDSEPGPRRFCRYAQTKFEGEQLARELYRRRGLPLISIYPCAVLGPEDHKITGPYIADIVNGRMPAQVFSEVPFTWVPVEDVARGIILAMEKDGNTGERYILGKEVITMGGIDRMISEIAGVGLPARTMPTPLALGAATLLTAISRLTRKAPPFRMSIEQVRVMSQGLHADGSKAERELGLTYTPVRHALEKIILGRKKRTKKMEAV